MKIICHEILVHIVFNITSDNEMEYVEFYLERIGLCNIIISHNKFKPTVGLY